MDKVSDNGLRKAVLWIVIAIAASSVLLVLYALSAVGHSMNQSGPSAIQPVESLLTEPVEEESFGELSAPIRRREKDRTENKNAT